jgi:hypothetical protein
MTSGHSTFAKEYSRNILAIDVNIDTTQMLEVTWSLFRKYFSAAEVGIKQEFMALYWEN